MTDVSVKYTQGTDRNMSKIPVLCSPIFPLHIYVRRMSAVTRHV